MRDEDPGISLSEDWRVHDAHDAKGSNGSTKFVHKGSMGTLISNSTVFSMQSLMLHLGQGEESCIGLIC
jgi:hypothetical protein